MRSSGSHWAPSALDALYSVSFFASYGTLYEHPYGLEEPATLLALLADEAADLAATAGKRRAKLAAALAADFARLICDGLARDELEERAAEFASRVHAHAADVLEDATGSRDRLACWLCDTAWSAFGEVDALILLREPSRLGRVEDLASPLLYRASRSGPETGELLREAAALALEYARLGAEAYYAAARGEVRGALGGLRGFVSGCARKYPDLVALIELRNRTERMKRELWLAIAELAARRAGVA